MMDIVAGKQYPRNIRYTIHEKECIHYATNHPNNLQANRISYGC